MVVEEQGNIDLRQKKRKEKKINKKRRAKLIEQRRLWGACVLTPSKCGGGGKRKLKKIVSYTNYSTE